MKDRIVKLAKEHGVSSRYTSFVVVEKRTGDRRVNEQAETRVVPVNAPAGWSAFKGAAGQGSAGGVRMSRIVAPPPSLSRPMAGAAMRPMAAPAMARSAPPPRASASALGSSFGSPPRPPGAAASSPSPPPSSWRASTDPLTAVLERQSASGMWEEAGRDTIEVTVDALLVLARLGVTTSHPTAGAQTKKAVDALLAALAVAPKVAPKLVELALATLWLLSTGRRTRVAIKDATAARPGLEDLAAALGRDDDVRAHVERIAPMC